MPEMRATGTWSCC